MRAIVQERYGSPDVLRLEEVDTPQARRDEVLVRVHAAGVNIGDWHLMRGIPYVMRLGTGPRRPRQRIPGMDVAGRVESVGADVSEFAPGDDVFGWCHGAFADYAVAPPDHLVPKPARLTLEQSAAVGASASTALAAVRDQGKVRAGQRVLINGASGGVGTFAVQIAKAYEAHVTGVCGTQHVDLVRSLGADVVIDYTRDGSADDGQRYDVMLDLVGNRSLSACRGMLTDRGTYVLVGVRDGGRWFGLGRQALALAQSPTVSQRMRVFVATHNRADLAVLRQLVDAGHVTPGIGARYALGEVGEALRHQGQGHPGGEIIVAMM